MERSSYMNEVRLKSHKSLANSSPIHSPIRRKRSYAS